MSYQLVEQLKREIEGFRDEAKFDAVGVVVEAGDGIARIGGLRDASSQELLTIQTERGDVPAVAFNLEESSIGAIVLAQSDAVAVGNRVRRTHKVLSLEVGEQMIGRVVNPLGEPIDNKGAIFTDAHKGKSYFLERPAPLVVDREPVRTPLHTGIRAIDAMIPIGRGQRELIIGDRQTGKTAIALDTILNQRQDKGRAPVICIYVAIGQKNAKIARMVRQLEEAGALEYTIIVSAPAASPATLQYLAPYAGCAIGEYFMEQGKDALVVYDDLSKHADAYRQLSLLLRRPPGREAYPGDIFYLHARLLERAAKLHTSKGGGSLTALPIVETKLNDVSAYIPTNVISITDGQIYLEADLFYQGIRPAINVGLSVSRVGSAAQTKAMKKVAGRLRLDLAQFRELKAFVQFASDLDERTRQSIRRGELLTEVLKQPDGSPFPLAHNIVALYAALHGAFDGVGIGEVQQTVKDFLEYVGNMHDNDIVQPIHTKGELDDAVEKSLQDAIKAFAQMRQVAAQ